MRNKLMVIRYSCHEDLIIRLKSCFDMCNIKYVVYKECDFTDGKTLYKILVDKNKCTWNQVMDEINVEGTKTADKVRKQIKDLEDECFCDL